MVANKPKGYIVSSLKWNPVKTSQWYGKVHIYIAD